MDTKIRLIATDLDGTLLQNYVPVCSYEAVELMNRFCEEDVYLVPASGRQFPNLKRMFAGVKGELLYLCENGALVMYRDEVLLKRTFSRELALELSHMVLNRPECEVLISGERTSYLVPKTQEYVTYMTEHIKNDVTVVRRPEDIEEPMMKVSFFTSSDCLPGVTEEFLSRTDGRCLTVVSGNEWVDFAPLGTSKGSALAVIGERLGIAPEEMAAFGDNENDRSMLEYVGHPYLMEQCNPTMEDVKARRCKRVEDVWRQIQEAGLRNPSNLDIMEVTKKGE